MRSKFWSKIILFVCFCIIPNHSVVCINFEGEDVPVGIGSPRAEDSSFGLFGDLMPPNFASYLSSDREETPDNFDDLSRYNKGKAKNVDEDFNSHIGKVYDSNPAKNMFDVLKFNSSNEQNSDDMDDDEDDDDQVKPKPMKSNGDVSPSWDKSIGVILEKAASIKESFSRLIGIGHKSSTTSLDETDGKSDNIKKYGDKDDDDDSEDGGSNTTTTKKDDKSTGNIFTKLFSKSKTTSSDSNHKVTTEASKTQATAKGSARNLTTVKDDDEDDDDDEEVESGGNSTSHTSTTIDSSISTTVTPLSPTITDPTNKTSTTKKGKSHKHKESSSTSTTPEPDNISSTETAAKKHHRHHHHHHHHHHHKHNTSTTTMPMNKTDTDGDDGHNSGNKTDHKSSLEIIESFLTGLGHKTDKMKENNTSTEAPAVIHSKTHKKKHRKSKHKKTSTVPPESLSTDLMEFNFNSSSTEKPENSSVTDTKMSTTGRPIGDTTTANSTSTTDSPSFPIISITRPTSDAKYSTTISPELYVNSSSSDDSSKSNSTTEIPTLGPYVEELDDIMPTESIVYSDWNPDVFP